MSLSFSVVFQEHDNVLLLREWPHQILRNKLIPDSIARDIEKACQGIYPLHDVHIRKGKVMKRPRFDLNKLMDMHGEGSGKTVVTPDAATGEAVERPEGYEPPVLESV